MSRFALFLLVVLLPAQAAGQDAGAVLSVDSALIGERFTLTLSAPPAEDRRALFPDPRAGDTLLGDLLLLRIQDTVRAEEGDVRVTYEATTFALDTAYLPPLPVRLVRGADTLLLLTPSLALPVRSVVPDTAAALRDLAPLFVFGSPRWPWILLALALLCLAGLLAYYLWHRRQPAAAPARPTPRVSPAEEALGRLDELEATCDPATQTKPYYIELSETLRRYLHRRLHAPALETTTGELVAYLGDRQDLPHACVRGIHDILALADLAKFADARPPAEKGRQALEHAREIIRALEDHHRPAPEASSVTEQS